MHVSIYLIHQLQTIIKIIINIYTHKLKLFFFLLSLLYSLYIVHNSIYLHYTHVYIGYVILSFLPNYNYVQSYLPLKSILCLCVVRLGTLFNASISSSLTSSSRPMFPNKTESLVFLMQCIVRVSSHAITSVIKEKRKSDWQLKWLNKHRF